MNPRPFYRSRLFWLGLPGLVFLLWGWWMSMGYFSGMMVGHGSLFVMQAKASIVAGWVVTSPIDWTVFDSTHEQLTVSDVEELPVMRELIANGSYALIPYYLPVLAYTATWLLTLAWWQRRKSRLLKLHTAP